MHEGTLITWVGRTEVGRERFRDDGRTLHSEVNFNGHDVALTIDRVARVARIEAQGTTVERPIPEGAVAVENGTWQAYAPLANGATDGTARTVEFLMVARGAVVPGTVRVTSGENGARNVEVAIGAVGVGIVVDSQGVVTRGSVASQRLEVLPEGVAPTPSVARAVPAGISESPLEVTRGGVTLRGVVWRPTNATHALPAVVFIAGSGPTDRDGNQPPGLATDTYRLLAEALAQVGIASVRYDKRGVGESGRNFSMDTTTLQDFVDDAAAVVAAVRALPGIGHITVAGHSEGGLIALMLAQHTPVDGLALLATAGRPLVTVLREQLARQLPVETLRDVDRIVAAIRAGTSPEPVPPALVPLFHPSVRAFLRSEMDLDPTALQHALHVPTVVVQGETDAQVMVEDAHRLAAARQGVRLVLLPRANHLFKEEASSALPQASYSDATRPLVAGVVEAIAALARR